MGEENWDAHLATPKRSGCDVFGPVDSEQGSGAADGGENAAAFASDKSNQGSRGKGARPPARTRWIELTDVKPESSSRLSHVNSSTRLNPTRQGSVKMAWSAGRSVRPRRCTASQWFFTAVMIAFGGAVGLGVGYYGLGHVPFLQDSAVEEGPSTASHPTPEPSPPSPLPPILPAVPPSLSPSPPPSEPAHAATPSTPPPLPAIPPPAIPPQSAKCAARCRAGGDSCTHTPSTGLLLVSAFQDINRGSMDGRGTDTYMNWFLNIAYNVQYPLQLYADAAMRASLPADLPANIFVRASEDVPQRFSNRYLQIDEEIMRRPEYSRNAQYGGIEHTSALYDLVNHDKVSFVAAAAREYNDTYCHLAWIDFGAVRSGDELWRLPVNVDECALPTKVMYQIPDAYQRRRWPLELMSEVNVYVLGSMWVTPWHLAGAYEQAYDAVLQNWHQVGCVDDDQQAVYQVIWSRPDLFQCAKGGGQRGWFRLFATFLNCATRRPDACYDGCPRVNPDNQRGECDAYCGATGACCREGWDTERPECNHGALGCNGKHCCVSRNSPFQPLPPRFLEADEGNDYDLIDHECFAAGALG